MSAVSAWPEVWSKRNGKHVHTYALYSINCTRFREAESEEKPFSTRPSVLPGHRDGGRPDDGNGGDDPAHVLRPLLLRPHDQPPPVQRDRHDRDRRDEYRRRLQQADHPAAELQEEEEEGGRMLGE